MLAIIFSFIIYVGLFTPKVRADESSLSAAPAIIEAVATVNEVVTKEVQITNTSTFPLPVKGQAAGFLSNEKLPETTTEKFNAASWITIEPSDFILQPKSVQSVKITITAPLGAEPGGHYATIYFTPLIPREAVSQEAAHSLARIGILTFLIVPGSLNQHLEIEGINAPTFSTYGPLNISYVVKNSGNIHLLPTGSLVIQNMLNKKVVNTPINPSIILPGAKKEDQISWGSKLMIGKYLAHIEVQNPDTSQPIIKSPIIELYIFPWPIVIGLILVLTLFYKLFIVNRKRLKLAWHVLRGHLPEIGD